MLKKSLLLILSTLLIAPISAKVTKEYQRPSLHLVLMTTSEEASAGTVQVADAEVLGYLSDAWKDYEFPALYNNFNIPLNRMDVSTAKGSIMELLAMYNSPDALQGMDISALKNIIDMLSGKQYREELKAEVEKVSNEVAKQLVKKWWSISEDGTVSDSLLFKLACYSATQNQINTAAETAMGAQISLVNELSDVTMANTYVNFTKVDFYENEPIAAFIRNIMMLVASMTPAPANLGVSIGADKAYEESKEGYTAFTNTLLYKLEWNETIANEFYSIWTDANHVDMDKFNNMKFNLVYVGNTSASATCMMKKEDKGQGAKHMVEKTVSKALNRQFADMQRKYEEFRPMVPVLGLDEKGGVIADMGTKEGVKVGDKFNLLEPVTNEKGITKYNYVATLKVVKWNGGEAFVNGVWDNESINQAEIVDTEGVSAEIIGTHLSKNKKATPSMFVKMTK